MRSGMSLVEYLVLAAAEPDAPHAAMGYRYWNLEDDGTLRPPLGTGIAWNPGLNLSRCGDGTVGGHSEESFCSCGLYAWAHRDGAVYCNAAYFDPVTAQVHSFGESGQRGERCAVVGAVTMFSCHRGYGPDDGGMLRADRAFVTALALPDGASEEARRRTGLAAARIGVEVVAAGVLTSASRATVARAERRAEGILDACAGLRRAPLGRAVEPAEVRMEGSLRYMEQELAALERTIRAEQARPLLHGQPA